MPAGLPGATLRAEFQPDPGPAGHFRPALGPKGSPFDKDSAGNYSTGGLSTGIGYGSPPVLDPISNSLVSNSLLGIRAAGFDDDDTPGQTKLDGTATTNSTYMYIGGGRSLANADPTSNPYTAGYGIGAAGNGAARDAGAARPSRAFRSRW
jgi:hypothetical protein